MKKSLSLIFIIAFIIRLIALNQSLWLDEGTTAKVVANYNYLEIITKFLPNDFHPPLYYLLMKLWTSFFGVSEISLRMPSIIFSLLTGYFVYKIGKLLKNKVVGLWSAIFFLFNPLIIYYSQEARMYLMATFLLTIALYYVMKKKLLSGLFFALAIATFYGSIFFIVAVLIYLLLKKQYQFFFVLCSILLIALLILSTLLFQQLTSARHSLQIVANWSLVLGKANLKNLLLIPIKFTSGRISFGPKKIYYLITSLWLAIIGFFFIKGVKRNYFLLHCFFVTLFLGFFISFITPLLQYFRFLYLIVLMSLLLSSNTNKNWQRYLLFIGLIGFSLTYLLNPQFHREDWRSLAKSIPVNTDVYAIPSSMDALLYYDNKLSINKLTSSQINGLDKTNEVLVIPYTTEIYGIDYKKILIKEKYKITNIKSFRGLTTEYWRYVGD